jgi:hypothetical protein
VPAEERHAAKLDPVRLVHGVNCRK